MQPNLLLKALVAGAVFYLVLEMAKPTRTEPAVVEKEEEEEPGQSFCLHGKCEPYWMHDYDWWGRIRPMPRGIKT